MNTKSKIYISIFIVFITVMIASASYAYLVRGRGVGDVLNSNVATASQKPVYSAYSEGDISFNITALQMSQLNVTTEAAAVDNANIYVDLTSSTDNEGTRCTYDLVWVWDSKDKYTTADVELPYTDEEGNVFPYELSIKINDQEERDLSSYTWDDTGSTILLENEVIESSSATEKTQKQYNIEVKAYNINAAQRNLFKKSFQAHIEVQNYNCYTSGAVVSYSGEYDGQSHTVYVSLSNQEKANNIYYSTTKLDKTNYKTVGSTTMPTRTESGTTIVYWCSEGGEICGESKIEIIPTNFANYIIKNVYTEDGENGLYHHDGVGTYTNANLEAGDNSYRYAGANPNNYVCFKEGCTDAEKYRIIGVFDNKVKLIKLTNDGNRQWNNINNNNKWEGSTLEKYLNDEYLSKLGDIVNIIDTVSWRFGGFTDAQRFTENANGIYNIEVSNTSIIERKIGLMYVNEYMYAAEPIYWNLVGFDRNNNGNDYRLSKGKDWIYTDDYSWSISVFPELHQYAHYVNPNAYITDVHGQALLTYEYGVHPTFSLLPTVKLSSGSGTSTDPYIVGLML